MTAFVRRTATVHLRHPSRHGRQGLQHDEYASRGRWGREHPPAPSEEGLRVRGLLVAVLIAIVPIALITLAAGYAAHRHSEQQPTIYEAGTRVILSTSGNFAPVDGSYTSSDRYVQNQADIMTTVEVLNRAAAVLNDGTQGADLRGTISAAPVGTSDVITITAQAGDPALAARRADAVAVGYEQFTTEQVQAVADQAVAASAADPVAVQTIRARAATFGDGVAVFQPATPPTEPATPNPRRDALLAGSAAFLLSTGLAVLWWRLRRPSGPDRLAAEIGGPLLGQVPVRWFGSAAVPRQPGQDAYGLALQALRYRLRDASDRSVLATAVGRDSSAASALLGLAAADAAQGRSVVLVDATTDGRLLRRAGVPAPSIPLNEASSEGHGLDGALEEIPSLAGPHGGSVAIARIERTTDDDLHRSLYTLMASADLLLVDVGAALHDAAAYSLIGEVGSVVAVVHRKPRAGDVRDFRRRLSLAGRQADGVLLTQRTWIPALPTPAPASAPPDRMTPTRLPSRPPVPSRAPAGDRAGSTKPSPVTGGPA